MNESQSVDFESISKLWTFVSSNWVTKALEACAKLNISTHLGYSIHDTKSSDEIAKSCGANPDAVYRLMRALTTRGIYRELDTPNRIFGHTPISILFVSENIKNVLLLFGSTPFYRGWENFTDSVITGKTDVTKSLGFEHCYQYLLQNPSDEVKMNKGMAGMTEPIIDTLIEMSDFTQFKTVADIGGSHGQLINEILKVNPNIVKGLNCDVQSVVDANKTNYDSKGYDSRLEHVAIDFFKWVPPADCYVLKYIFHNWSDQEVVQILKTLADSLEPNGKIYDYDFVLENTQKSKEQCIFPYWLDLQMLNLFGGKERTRENLELLADQAGLKIERIVNPPHLVCQKLTIFSKK